MFFFPKIHQCCKVMSLLKYYHRSTQLSKLKHSKELTKAVIQAFQQPSDICSSKLLHTDTIKLKAQWKLWNQSNKKKQSYVKENFSGNIYQTKISNWQIKKASWNLKKGKDLFQSFLLAIKQVGKQHLPVPWIAHCWNTGVTKTTFLQPSKIGCYCLHNFIFILQFKQWNIDLTLVLLLECILFVWPHSLQ